MKQTMVTGFTLVTSSLVNLSGAAFFLFTPLYMCLRLFAKRYLSVTAS